MASKYKIKKTSLDQFPVLPGVVSVLSNLAKLGVSCMFRPTSKGRCLLTIDDTLSQSWPSERLRQMISSYVVKLDAVKTDLEFSQ